MEQSTNLTFHKLTELNLQFSNTSINFGNCFLNESCSSVLEMSNNSLLPIKFGFINLKKEITIQPNNGFGVVLPNETIVSLYLLFGH